MLNLTMAGALVFVSAAFVRIDVGVTLMAGIAAIMFIVRESLSKESDNDR